MKLQSYVYCSLLVSLMFTTKQFALGFGKSLLLAGRRTTVPLLAPLFSTTSDVVRPSSMGLSLDTNLIASQLDLVLSHMKARRADGKLLEDIAQIQSLREERNALIVEGDNQKNVRNKISKEIGMRMGKMSKATDDEKPALEK